MKIFILRHGETDWNIENRCQGWKDVPLNSNGLLQSEKIISVFANEKVDKIFSSPLSRAYKLADKLSKFKQVPVVIVDDFMEINFGKWEGLTIDEIKVNYPDLYNLWRESPEKIKFPDGESFSEFFNRIWEAFIKIIEGVKSPFTSPFSKGGERGIIIVSHGMVNRLILCHILGLNIGKFRYLSNDNASISEIIVETLPEKTGESLSSSFLQKQESIVNINEKIGDSVKRLVIEKMNDTCHLL